VNGSLKRLLVGNTAANYALVAARFATAIVVTRMLYLGLPGEAYGFWALLWSVFGYSLLLDFGFGTSVQKHSAELLVNNDYGRFNRLLNTVVGSYSIMSLAIIVATIASYPFLDHFVKFAPGADIDYFGRIFLVFGLGTAAVFPTGVFAEILRGINRAYLRNIVQVSATLCNVAGIYLVFRAGMGLLALTIFSLSLNLAANVAMAGLCMRYLPGLRLDPRRFDRHMLGEVLSFSLFAYLIMFANMVIYKTDQIVLSVTLGVGAVAVYQVGSRLSTMLVAVTTQFQDTLAPVAAALFSAGQIDRLRRILVDSNRIIAFVSTFPFLVLTVLAEPILMLWLDERSPVAVHTTYILNSTMYLIVLFRSGSSKVLLMAGRHRFLAVTAVVEAASNVVLSLLFIRLWGIVGVSLGTLVPATIVSCVVIFPAAASFSGISIREYLSKAYVPVLAAALPCAAMLWWFRSAIDDGAWSLAHLAGASAAAGAVYGLFGLLFVVRKEDWQRLRRGKQVTKTPPPTAEV